MLRLAVATHIVPTGVSHALHNNIRATLFAAGFRSERERRARCRQRPITAQDLWTFKRLATPALAPDGQTVVVAVQEWSIEENRNTTNLWIIDVASGRTRGRAA
jgi:hypothetical protein